MDKMGMVSAEDEIRLAKNKILGQNIIFFLQNADLYVALLLSPLMPTCERLRGSVYGIVLHKIATQIS